MGKIDIGNEAEDNQETRTEGYCHGSSSSAPTYNPTTPSIYADTSESTSSRSSGSGDNCISSGTIAYQACVMAVEGVTNDGSYYISDGKCCMPSVAEPELEPID